MLWNFCSYCSSWVFGRVCVCVSLFDCNMYEDWFFVWQHKHWRETIKQVARPRRTHKWWKMWKSLEPKEIEREGRQKICDLEGNGTTYIIVKYGEPTDGKSNSEILKQICGTREHSPHAACNVCECVRECNATLVAFNAVHKTMPIGFLCLRHFTTKKK